MNLTSNKREKLRQLLLNLSPDEEKVGKVVKNQGKMIAVLDIIDSMEKGNAEKFGSLDLKMSEFSKSLDKHGRNNSKLMNDIVERFIEELKGLRGDVRSSKDTNGPPLFKDIINFLAEGNKYHKKTAERIESWKWPQYSSVSLRNKSFSNINPAVASGDTFNASTNVNISSAAQIIAKNTNAYKRFIINNGTDTVFIGDSTVTTSNGFPLMVGASVELDVTAAIWGVANSGTQDIRYMEIAS